MKNSNLWFNSFVMVISVLFSPTYADTPNNSRLNQLLEIMDSAENPGAIDANELAEFIFKKRNQIFESLEDIGLNVNLLDDSSFARYLELEAHALLNNIDKNGDGIRANEVEKFENSLLPPPFNTKVASLLPPIMMGNHENGALNLTNEMPRVEISIRRSFLDKSGIGRPALITWTKYSNQDETIDANDDRSYYDFEGAIDFSFPKLREIIDTVNYGTEVLPVAVIEGSISSNTSDIKDQILHRIGFDLTSIRKNSIKGVSAHYLDFTLDYITGRNYESDRYGATLQYTFDNWDIGLGKNKPLLEPGLSFRWRPYFGITTAHVTDAAGNEELEKFESYTNAYLKLAMQFSLGKSERFKFTPELTQFTQLENRKEQFSHRAAGLTYTPVSNQNVSFTLSHSNGRVSPLFVKEDVTKLGIGWKLN